MARALLLAVSALATAEAFSVAPTMRPRTHHAAARLVAVTPRTEAPEMALPLSARLALSVPTMYALMSVNEYVTHRYFQHAEFNREPTLQKLWCFFSRQKEAPKIRGGGHVEHHAETYDDMSLKNDARWSATPASKSLDSDVFRGTAFSWQVTGLMTIQMLPTTLPAFALLGLNLVQTFAVLMPGMLLHALLWNALHPPMHGLPRVPFSYGAPSWVLSGLLNTPFFKWIYENHMGHHVLGGQVNYNVCCPMTDHLLGTYVPTSVWRHKMRALPEGASVRGAVVEPAGVPKPPTWQEQKLAREASGATPAVLAGGGSLIADAYTSSSSA